jgi:MFS transporter, DHA1 family, inner membrane transport protein
MTNQDVKIKPKEDTKSKYQIFIGSLTLSNFCTNMMDFLMSVFLIDIAIAFLGSASNANVATMSRLVTVSNLVSFITGIVIGYLCLKIKYKILLMTGLLCITVGGIGCFLAFNPLMLQLFYLFDGIGTVLISSMAYSIIGEHLPDNKKGIALGCVIAGAPISGLIGSFVISMFFGFTEGWRSFMLFYVVPISIISLIIVYFTIPLASKIKEVKDEKSPVEALNKGVVISKMNVFACLLGNFFRYMASAWQIFAIALIRTKFNVTAESGATMILIGNVGLIIGMITAGKLANKFGRKKLLVISTFCLSFVFISFINSTSFIMATAVWLVSGTVGGLSFSSDLNFTLGQMPKIRGSLMSINSGFIYLGFAIGSAIGSFILPSFGYQIVGYTFTLFLVIASMIFLTFAKDPTNSLKKLQ